jgi:hypothetical protein
VISLAGRLEMGGLDDQGKIVVVFVGWFGFGFDLR